MKSVVEIGSSSRVGVSIYNRCKAIVSKVIIPIRAAVSLTESISGKLFYNKCATAKVNYKSERVATVELVYTSTISNDLELWWTDSWKALWNNKLKILWRKG